MPTPSTDLSPADRTAHRAASHVRRPQHVLARVPAGNPRGSWPAEHAAQELRDSGQPADVVMDRESDDFLVVARAVGVTR